MISPINIKSLLVKILSLLLLCNITILANNLESKVSDESKITEFSTLEARSIPLNETVEVSLDSFGNIGILITIVLSSLLGAFFVKDEFASLLEEKV